MSEREWNRLTPKERKQFDAIRRRDPVVALLLRMKQLDLTRRDIEPYIGTRARVSEVLNRRRDMSIDMMRNLNKFLGIPADHLIAEPRP